MSERYKVAIIGAGPGGLAAGVQAAKRGVSHVLLERGELANTVHRYQKGKLVMAEPARLSIQPDLALSFEEGSREAVLQAWQDGLEAGGVNLMRGPEYDVTGLAGQKGDFSLTLRSGETLSTENVIISMGMQGNLRTFNVPGQELPHVSYQLDDPGAFVDKKIVVVGVGDAGIENALALKDDNEVSIVNRRDEFDRAKRRNRSAILKAIDALEVKHYQNSSVKEFHERAVVLKTDDGEVELEVDLVIGRLGALPPRAFLEGIGVEFPSDEKEAVPVVSDRFESNVPGVYIVGALIGRPLIKACMNGGYEAVEYILGNEVVHADEPLLAGILAKIPRGSVGVSAAASDNEFVSAVVQKIRDVLPVFNSLTPVQLRELLLDSIVHKIEPGGTPVVLYEKGHFSNTLYTILEGAIDVHLDEKKRSLAGDFFGEGGLLTGRPRMATVSVPVDSIFIETHRFAMNKLIRDNPQVDRAINAAAVERALADLLGEMSEEERRAISEEATIERFSAGERLFSEGDEPDGLHLIRRGSVSISRKDERGEDTVRALRSAGDNVGEVALLTPDGARTASITALQFTETILIPPDQARRVLERNPELTEAYKKRARLYAQSDALPHSKLYSDVVLKSGVSEATDMLVIEESLCIRCNNCEDACKDTHGGVSRIDREAGPRFAEIHFPTACQHCENPKCMTDCPPNCIERDPSGMVYIETSECISCGNCVSYCPYDAIVLAVLPEQKRPNLLMRLLFGEPDLGPYKEQDGDKKVALKCDMCRDVVLPNRPDGGKGVACVQSCPTGAIVRVRPETVLEVLLQEGT